MKRKFITLIIAIILLSSINFSYASKQIQQSTNDKLNINAESAILIDEQSGNVLYEKNSSQRMYPASTTKLLTAILIAEKYQDLSQKANVSYYAVHKVPYSYSIASLIPGEQISLKDLLDSLMVASANDSAFVLAEYMANDGNNYPINSSADAETKFKNSIESFSNMMNQKAKDLGCKDSNFVNPNGIHNENHYSTAYDLALIGKYAYNNSTIMSFAQKLSATLSNSKLYTGNQRTFTTTNLLLHKEKSGYYEYANGLKTGYTDAAKYCIIASAKKDDRNLIVVILHSDNCTNPETSRESDCKKLFEYGFNNYINTTLINSGDIVRTLYVLNGTSKTKSLNIYAESNLKVLMKKGAPLDITPQINLTKHFAPISKGEIVGTITYTINNVNYTSNLLADHDVYSLNYEFIIIILASIFIILIFTLSLIIRRKNRKK